MADLMHPHFIDQSQQQRDLLVETPMDRYECCDHCFHRPHHHGHPDPCDRSACPQGKTLNGEP